MRTKATRVAGGMLRDCKPIFTRSTLALSIAAALSGTMSPVVHADETVDSDSSLAEIVVTSRKRAENLQDVPISIDVFSSKDLQNQDISQFEDYASRTPSISFISAGPGTQTFVMRGVSDGSNPNYSNTATTAFLLDDMSMNYYGTTPDLHFYDIDRIEVLNGPQGTTFGAGAMAGAIRFITNKPDASGFAAGVDLQGGKIDGGTRNGTAEGFINIPLIPDWTAIRLSVYRDFHGGYINNINTTREWVNGVTSDNSAFSGNNYNVEKVTGGRLALMQKFAEGWKATLTGSYQRQLTHGSWDQDSTIGGAVDYYGNVLNGNKRPAGRQNVSRFGPEYKQYYTKTLDFHLDGDVGIGDLVYAGTYWAQDDRWVNEYSEYMQYVNTGTLNASTQQAFDCLTDPINNPGVGYSGCNAPTQSYDYINHTDRWSHELRLSSKAGGFLHWVGGVYWEKTRDIYSDYYHMPGLQVNGAQYQAFVDYYGTTTSPPAPDDWYSYVGRSDYLQTSEFGNLTWDILPSLHLEVGTEHFHSSFSSSSYGGFWYAPQSPSTAGGSSRKWNSKGGLSWNVTKDVLLYADAAQGFRDGGVNLGIPSSCLSAGVPQQFQPDSLTNYEFGWKTTWLDKHLLVDGAIYYMPWKNVQSSIYNPGVCAAASFNTNVGDARVYGVESDIKYQPNSFWSFEFSGSYNDSRVKSNKFSAVDPTTGVPILDVLPGERLPYVPYFSWSANARYEHPLKEALHGYVQYDAERKGDMYNTLENDGSNGLPRLLQPAYTIMNVRFGINNVHDHWLGELFITNLVNKNAVVYTNEGNFDLRQTITEPRVFGARLSYRFGKQGANTSD